VDEEKKMNETIIIDFNEIGLCIIDVDKAVKGWTEKCSISRWHNKYRLIRIKYKKVIALKIKITEEQAKELINKLDLVEIKSETFTNGSTYRLKENEL